MKRKLIVANWKMNMLRNDATELLVKILNGLSFPLGCDVVIAPPYTAINTVGNVITGYDIEIGAQDVFWEQSGPFTGEISPSMLVDVGCDWVIIGHSERRTVFGETDDIVRKKVNTSLRTGLKVILCVGETSEQRDEGKVSEIINQQVSGVIDSVEEQYLDQVVIAYEPVWAIGTGVNASSYQIEEVHQIIMDNLIAHFGKDAHTIRILYGGSVKKNNIDEILSLRNVDGALVGGASLDSDSFIKIIESAGV